MLKFLDSGGPFMYAILGLSIIAAGFIIQKYFILTFSYPIRKNFFSKIIKKIKSNNLKSAFKMCRSTGHPLADVITEILKNYDQPVETIESAANTSIQKIVPKILKGTNYIQMIGNIATLVGLLGTIQGLILSFTSLAGADAASKAELLAKGISTAMNTTAFGLIVAVPCIVSFTILSNKENAILQKYDETVNDIIHLLAYDKKDQGHNNNFGHNSDNYRRAA